jgi:hypothetical protein
MKKLLFAVLFLSGMLWGQAKTVVSGNIQDITGIASTKGFVEFDIQPLAGSVQYFVKNTGIIAPQKAQCGINATGDIKNLALTGDCLLWGNDLIMPSNTCYVVKFAPNGVVTNTVSNYLITGATYSLMNPRFCTIVNLVPQYVVVTANPIAANLIPAADDAFTLGTNQLRYVGHFSTAWIDFGQVSRFFDWVSQPAPSAPLISKIRTYSKTGDIFCYKQPTGVEICLDGVAIPHNLLSVTHLDTTPASVAQGDIVIGHGGTPLWSRLGIGAPAEVLTVVGGEPAWQPAGGGGITCTIAGVTDWYVDPAGNDTTGDGTIGLPWLTPQHAVDQLPGLVCGRYIIHLKSAGTYTGGVTINGRVFAGGSGGGANQSGTVQWPINDGNYPPAYSWVEILGDDTDTAPSTYIITAINSSSDVVSIAGGNLILRGLTVKGNNSGSGQFGVRAANAFVGMSGVLITAPGVGFGATEGSTIWIDNNDFVDPSFTSSVLITNLAAGSPYAWILDDSLLTDYRSDGNNTSTNAILGYETGTGGSLVCGLAQYSRIWFRGTINCDVNAVHRGILATHSQLSIAKMTIDGHSLGTNTGIDLQSSQLSGAPFGGGNWTVKNLAKGVSIDPYSWIDSLPTFSGNTVNWVYTLTSPASPLNHSTYVANVTKLAQTSAITTTTLLPAGAGIGTFRVALVINCTVIGAGDTITPTITYKDASNTTQTITAAAADCTALGAGSITSINAVFRANSNIISYETSIATTPNYDITVTLERLTVD